MSLSSRWTTFWLIGAALLLGGGCRREPPAAPGADAAPHPTTVQAEVVVAPPRPRALPSPDLPYHGLAWQIHHAKDSVEQARRLLAEIADLGADTVLISNAGYQEHAASEAFKIDPAVTPSEAQWRDIFKIARGHGLRVILMPIILLSDPRGNEWRGVISPPSWDDWFEQYREFLMHFARIAEANHVEVLSVGSELVSAEKYMDQWRKLITDVRKVFTGKLTYSANWDHYLGIEFWDQLDLVGMTSYYMLSSEPNPPMDRLMKQWIGNKPDEGIKGGILRFQQGKGKGKPLLFTEVGWPSQEGASIEPWNYYYKQEATPAGLEEQRRCYRAFMDAWADTPEVGGVIWWEWNDDPGGKDDYKYTPRGKPAEQELRAWFARVRNNRRPTAEAPTPPPSAAPPTSRPADRG